MAIEIYFSPDQRLSHWPEYKGKLPNLVVDTTWVIESFFTYLFIKVQQKTKALFEKSFKKGYKNNPSYLINKILQKSSFVFGKCLPLYRNTDVVPKFSHLQTIRLYP